MMHIEFTGPAGSGKSTIVNNLTSKCESLICRNELIRRHILPDWFVLDNLLHSYWESLAKYWWSEYTSYQYFFKFARRNPDFVSECVSFIQKNRGGNNGAEISTMNMLSVHQLANDTIKDDEMFVLDEGFYHKTAVHAKHGELPSDHYFSSMPSPDILIHIDPPIEVARRRCKDRDGTVATHEQYKQARQTKRELISMAKEKGIQVIEVNNEDEVKFAVQSIQSKIFKNKEKLS